MRVFVAGATGVIGRRVVPLLVQAGHSVTGMARSEEKRSRLKQQGAEATEVDLFDPDAVTRAVSGHDDAASAVFAALNARAGIYNIVDDEPVRRREMFGTMAGALGVGPPRFLPSWLARLMGSVGEFLSRSQRISNRKFREETGWTPRYPSVREGIPTLVSM